MLARFCPHCNRDILGSDVASIDELGLSARAYNALRRRGIDTVADLLGIIRPDYSEYSLQLRCLPGVGTQTADEIVSALVAFVKRRGCRG